MGTPQCQINLRNRKADPGMTMLTLFADASLHHETGAAGWGAWAIREGWPKGVIMGGPIKRKITSSTVAEMCALAAALWQLRAEDRLAEVKSFMLQSDSTEALSRLLCHLPNARISQHKSIKQPDIRPLQNDNKVGREAIDAIAEITFGKQVWLRHVKGHNGTGDGRSWVNEVCDRQAKRYMRALRAELEKQI